MSPGLAGSGAGGSTSIAGAYPAPEPMPEPIEDELTGVVPSDGCGQPYEGISAGKQTIQTMGTKDADCAAKLSGEPKCGPWATARDYYVNLPPNYDPNKPYSLVFEGPGCGGNGLSVFRLADVSNTAIRVGLTPGPNSLGHGSNENQGCFDDAEGDDSIDFVLYENLYDKLNAQLCFDRNRVFAAGNGSGARLVNEMGAKYAGDPKRPVRGVMTNGAGLPTDDRFMPLCTMEPLAGVWIYNAGDINNQAGVDAALALAMERAECPTASYDTATFDTFPIGGGMPDGACKRILGCNPLAPLVTCVIPGVSHGINDALIDTASSTFIKLFSAPPLLQ